MTAKRDVTEIIGENESFQDFCHELNRRAAVLDFLALYNVAKEEDIVKRVKHIIHAEGFSQFKPKHWEMYLTRLLGRCLRHTFDGYQMVEKQRNSFNYTILPTHGDHGQYRQIFDIRKMIVLDWPWYPYGPEMQRYRQDTQLYWRTRGLVDPTDVDALYAVWNQFQARIDRYDRCQIQGNSLHLNYGNTAYNRYTHGSSFRIGSYNTHEAYLHLKGWMVEADRFLESDELIFNTAELLRAHERHDDGAIEREILRDNRAAADIARERAENLAREREREAAIAEAVGEQEERELTLAESVMENLRERGLVE